MFKAVDPGGNYKASGLGIDEETWFRQAYLNKTADSMKYLKFMLCGWK